MTITININEIELHSFFPEWTTARKAFELPEEHNHNGRSEAQHPEEMSVMSVVAPVPQVKGVLINHEL